MNKGLLRFENAYMEGAVWIDPVAITSITDLLPPAGDYPKGPFSEVQTHLLSVRVKGAADELVGRVLKAIELTRKSVPIEYNGGITSTRFSDSDLGLEVVSGP